MKRSMNRCELENLEERLLLSTQLVGYQLAITDMSGTPITAVQVGQDFELRAYAEDLRSSPHGVFAGYMDVAYNSSFAHAKDGTFTYGTDYPNVHSGTAASGLLDEAGACADTTELGAAQRCSFTSRCTPMPPAS